MLRAMGKAGSGAVPAAPQAGAAMHRAVADTVREAIALFTHDLSNPLQSMMVLIELAMDDVPPGPAHGRLEQALGASTKMRDMLQSFARVCRVGSEHEGEAPAAGVALRRCTQMLQRRCERLHLAIHCHDEPVAAVPLPAPQVELAMLGILLSAVAVLARTEHQGGEITVVGSIPRKLGGHTARLEFGIAGIRGQDTTLSTLSFDRARIQRAQMLLDGSRARLMPHPNGSVRLEFPAAGAAPSPPG